MERMLAGACGVLVLLAGCGGGNGRADAGPETGGADGDVGGICSSLVPGAAATLTTTIVPNSPPDTPAGGTITPGTYFGTSSILYVPTCSVLPGAPGASALRITAPSATAGLIDMALSVTVPGEQHLVASSYSYTISGTTMTRTLRCYTLDGVDGSAIDGGIPAGKVTSGFYTATATEIRLYTALGSPTAGGPSCGTEVLVFQKQPD